MDEYEKTFYSGRIPNGEIPAENKENDVEKKESYGERQKKKRAMCYSMADEAAFDSVSSPEKMRAFLKVLSRFESYSLKNNLLIANQRPDATQIKSYEDWQKAEQSIKSGAKSFLILEPQKYVADGVEKTGYNAKAMFDVSDCQSPAPVNQPAVDLSMLLRALVSKAPMPIHSASNYPADKTEGAFYHVKSKTVYCRPGMSDGEIFTSVAAALAHAEMAKGVDDYRTEDHDFSARCVAYALAEKNHVPSDSVTIYSIPPTLKNKDSEDIQKVLGEIHGCVRIISGRMKEYMSPSKDNAKDKDNKEAR